MSPSPIFSSELLPRAPKGGGGGGGGGGGKGGGGGGSKSGGSKGSSSKSKGSSLSGSSFGKKVSTSTKGGGKKFKIKSGPFAGREAGGGSRVAVFGGAYYGSGYPYGGGSGWAVGQRPLPFVYWPVFIYPTTHSYDSGIYGPSDNSNRPGGIQTAATVQSPSDLSVTYRIMGDRESVLSVTDSLVSACKIVRPIPYSYKPTLGDNTNDSRPKPEQIIQYYRASSFILSLDGYNNTFALPSNAPSNNNDGPRNTTMVPLPNISDRNFLNCVNSTIGDKIPLIQPDPALSAGAITGIVFAGIFAIVILFACCKYFLFVRLVNGLRKVKPRKKSTYQNIDEANIDTRQHEEQPDAAGHHPPMQQVDKDAK